MSTPFTFGVVGAGWRAEFFVRLARLLSDQLTLVGASVRRSEVAEQLTQRWGVPAFLSPTELVHGRRPDFVISCVPSSANPKVVTALVESGVHVLSETPPAPDLDGLRKLWAQVGGRDLVQVAEQYLLMPGHAARRELVTRGVIGQPTAVQVSSTHNYHAVSMIRGLLGIGFEPVKVSATRFTAPLVDPLSRTGWTGDDTPKEAATTLATMDFGGASGLYDFTDNQWHNQLRLRRIVIRGSHLDAARRSMASTRSSLQPRIHRCYLRQRRPIQLPHPIRDAFQRVIVQQARRRQWHISRVRGRQCEPNVFQSEFQLESGWFEFAACDKAAVCLEAQNFGKVDASRLPVLCYESSPKVRSFGLRAKCVPVSSHFRTSLALRCVQKVCDEGCRCDSRSSSNSPPTNWGRRTRYA